MDNYDRSKFDRSKFRYGIRKENSEIQNLFILKEIKIFSMLSQKTYLVVTLFKVFFRFSDWVDISLTKLVVPCGNKPVQI